MSKAIEDVIEIEKGFWTKANEPDYFKEHMADQALSVIEPMGFLDKSQAVNMPAEKPWKDVEMLDLRATEITPDCVIVAYHGKGRREGDREPYQSSIASTYIRADGRWLLALSAHQPWQPKNGGGPKQA
ncbi:MAG TPA: hypothetical protein VGG90_04960 [Candidatus Dormibacteraeota bacterium]|jgi:hypothetical protein